MRWANPSADGLACACVARRWLTLALAQTTSALPEALRRGRGRSFPKGRRHNMLYRSCFSRRLASSLVFDAGRREKCTRTRRARMIRPCYVKLRPGPALQDFKISNAQQTRNPDVGRALYLSLRLPRSAERGSDCRQKKLPARPGLPSENQKKQTSTHRPTTTTPTRPPPRPTTTPRPTSPTDTTDPTTATETDTTEPRTTTTNRPTHRTTTTTTDGRAKTATTVHATETRERRKHRRHPFSLC